MAKRKTTVKASETIINLLPKAHRFSSWKSAESAYADLERNWTNTYGFLLASLSGVKMHEIAPEGYQCWAMLQTRSFSGAKLPSARLIVFYGGKWDDGASEVLDAHEWVYKAMHCDAKTKREHELQEIAFQVWKILEER